MPSSPTGLCRDCTSRAINNTRYCSRHQVNNQRRQGRITYDELRSDDEVRKLYRTKRWKAIRPVVFRRDNFLCRACGFKAATEVDHTPRARIILDEFGVDEFFALHRLTSLCHECHAVKTKHELGFTKGGTNLKASELGNRSNTTVVCGQAGSGKTTHVANHKADLDAVWDYDVIMSDLTGLPMHQHSPEYIGSVLAHRDNWIQATQYCKYHCWLIVTNPKAVIVGMMRDAGANVIVLDTSEDECNKRLRARYMAQHAM